ncbi:nitrate reductase [Thioclava sp. SK-1]|uniref:nitrate reductase n=1 Tax=Thioclava sp. SK-1 TaxID=1889770 RepID=UPI000825C5C4|nr:nitrate reductase [Thioclava sp. SK-1]OCX67076.1 nitrate reductase [Thioclava sp. SK-1]
MTSETGVETRSTCPYCGVGCGVLIARDGAGGITVRGDPDHPTNKGRLCSKGSALGETVGLETRILQPQIDGAPATWDSALDLVAQRFSDTVAQHGPDAVAFYVSGQLLTEDYYVANKLMKGFIGSANIDTNSRLCMASTVAGHKRAFGTDTVPGTYDDLEEADLIVLVGSNLAWCHPILYQRIMAARADHGTKLVVIDPRKTATSDGADLHLALRAGSDVALFNALLAQIDARGACDAQFTADHVDGVAQAITAAHLDDPTQTGLSPEDLTAFCDLWIGTPKVVTIFSQGVNQSSSGTDKVNAILNCHLATGRIGTPGAGPFSVTGQPNAMGGREVGGLANMLACHLDIENPDHRAAVGAFWDAPNLPSNPGLKAVEMFRAVADGRIKALWIIHSNPAVTMPDANAVAAAIAACPFTVVSDITAQTDTARLADVILPATAWSEKSGTVTNSDRMMSRQRAVQPAPGQARPDWHILAEVAARMGWAEAFDFASEADVFAEYAALSGVAAQFGRDFDISALAGISAQGYAELAPLRWPQSAQKQGGRFFGDGVFYHPGGKAKMLPVTMRAPAAQISAAYPFRLNTGRLRDQWHTMTRTALSSRLSAHMAEPFVDMHPDDAARLGLEPADLVQLSSLQGQAIVRLHITKDVAKGDLFVPIHWTGENAPSARVDALVADVVDPISGQPESKAAVVSAERFLPRWYGFAISSRSFTPDCAYWARARTTSGFRAELAGTDTIADWEAQARTLFDLPDARVQSLTDAKRGRHRLAFYDNEVLLAALYIAPQPVTLMRDFLVGLPGTEAAWALAGQARGDTPDPGPVVCSCFAVGRNTVRRAITQEGLTSVDRIGASLSAGTNCGSCKSELAAILREATSLAQQ